MNWLSHMSTNQFFQCRFYFLTFESKRNKQLIQENNEMTVINKCLQKHKEGFGVTPTSLNNYMVLCWLLESEVK